MPLRTDAPRKTAFVRAAIGAVRRFLRPLLLGTTIAPCSFSTESSRLSIPAMPGHARRKKDEVTRARSCIPGTVAHPLRCIRRNNPQTPLSSTASMPYSPTGQGRELTEDKSLRRDCASTRHRLQNSDCRAERQNTYTGAANVPQRRRSPRPTLSRTTREHQREPTTDRLPRPLSQPPSVLRPKKDKEPLTRLRRRIARRHNGCIYATTADHELAKIAAANSHATRTSGALPKTDGRRTCTGATRPCDPQIWRPAS